MNQEKIVMLVNQEREKEGKKALTLNSFLTLAAEKKTLNMKNGNYFLHESRAGESITTFIPKEYRYSVVGENLAFGFQNEENLLRAWMKSPSHRANILDPEYHETGLGIFSFEDKFLIAQVFGSSQTDLLDNKAIIVEPSPQIFSPFFFWSGLMIFIAVLIPVMVIKLRKSK